MKEEGESEALEGDKFVVFGISPVQPEKCHLSIMFTGYFCAAAGP